MLNIHFEALEDKSHDNALAGYARFVELAKTMPIYQAVNALSAEGYLKEFLEDEVRRYMFAEVFSYDYELREAGRKAGHAEGHAKGKAEGHAKGKAETLAQLKALLSQGADPAKILATLETE